MLKQTLKNLIPSSFKAYVRLGDEKKKFRDRIDSLKDKKVVLLIGTPLHTNLGDHLIALAEADWIGKDVVEIPREVYQLYKKKLSGIDADVYITGGGWMGDLWPNEEKDIQDMVKLFKDKKIVILPQTVYYKDENSPLIKRGNDIYRNCKDITLCVREKNSFDTAKRLIDIDKLFLVPDIGLLYKFDSEAPDHGLAGVCIRNDREAIENGISSVIALIEEAGYKVTEVSTMSGHRVGEEEREEAVDDAISDFAKCGLIVADRLHAMIFAYIAGRPCIAFDNKTHKVSGVYDKWLSDCPYILMVRKDTKDSDIKEFIEKTKGKTYKPEKFEKYFEVIHARNS